MSKNTWWAKLLRFLSIFLLGVTSLFTLAGGAGTTCVALDAAKYGEPMSAIAPYQWLYQIFVLVTVAIGIVMTRATILLAKGQGKGYKSAVIALISGVVVGVIHIVVSRYLRGASMPVDGVVYVTVLTLIVFLLLLNPLLGALTPLAVGLRDGAKVEVVGQLAERARGDEPQREGDASP